MNIQTLIANAKNYGGVRYLDSIRYLVIHYTANDGDTARANAEYYNRAVVKASAHYFVDDNEIWQSVPDSKVAWSVGGKKWADCPQTGGGTLYGVVTNTNSLSVELCDTRKDGVYGASEETLANAAALCRELMELHQIPLERVVRHFDVTGKHCPAYFMDSVAWEKFKTRLAGTQLDNTPSPAHKVGVEWAKDAKIIQGNADGDLMLHQGLTREQFCTMTKRTVDWLTMNLKMNPKTEI